MNVDVLSLLILAAALIGDSEGAVCQNSDKALKVLKKLHSAKCLARGNCEFLLFIIELILLVRAIHIMFLRCLMSSVKTIHR